MVILNIPVKLPSDKPPFLVIMLTYRSVVQKTVFFLYLNIVKGLKHFC